MGAAVATVVAGGAAPAGNQKGAKQGGKKKLILIAVPVLLIAVGAGLWFSGILPGLLGMSHSQSAEVHAEGQTKEMAAHVPVFVELPEMVANLNVPGPPGLLRQDPGARRTGQGRGPSRLHRCPAPGDRPVSNLFARGCGPRSCGGLPARTGCVRN